MTNLSPAERRVRVGIVALCCGLLASAVFAQETGVGIEFSARGVPGLETIYLEGTGTDDPGGLLRIDVRANEITDLYGVSLALQFPEKLLRFPKSRSSAFVEGPFLSANGAEETILLVRLVENEIIVGLSRKGESAGMSGSGLLVSLEFRGLEVSGKRALRFRRTAAFDAEGQEIENTTWLAGKVVIKTSD